MIFDLYRYSAYEYLQGKEEEGTSYVVSISLSRSDRTCASSDGGPGLNFEEDIAGRSRLGTRKRRKSFSVFYSRGKIYCAPKNPSFGLSNDGSQISAFTPHTTVVSPNRTRAEPSAVDIDPIQPKKDQLCCSDLGSFRKVGRTYLR